jgi:putative tryptophan/tyrosine transport system substrate-binding protein
MKRRAFITHGTAAAVAWPLAARGQQPAMPVIGFLSSLSSRDATRIMTAFQHGLNEAGYSVGRNVAIEFRWAEAQYERLPALAADLVRRQVSVIAAISGTPSVLAAKAATASIPIVFAMGSDPVESGLVPSLNRPGGNVTGATFFTASLGAKRLELLRELVSNKNLTIALLVNPRNRPGEVDATNVQAAAHALAQRVKRFDVSSADDIDRAFAASAREPPDGMYVGPDPLFINLRDKVVALAARHSIPAIYADREIVEEGGLISYGTSRTDAYRQAGVYVARILKGEKPADLPVVLPSKYQLVINLKTAKALGLIVPLTLQASADEVVE